MRRFTLSILAAAALAVAPATASAQSSGQTIPVPNPTLVPLGHTPMVELWDGGGGLPYLGSSSSYNAGDWENTLKTYHDSGVYLRQLSQVDTVAQEWVRRVARPSNWGKYKLQRKANTVKVVRTHKKAKHAKKTAIVFDIDETALSNYSAIVADNFTFGTNSKAETTNETGTQIKPTRDVFNLAKSKSVAVFFVTGRGETPDNRAHTEHNLLREGFGGYKQLFLKPAGFTGTTTDYKSATRKSIEQQGYRIIASIGDQYSDLAGGHEAAAFKLPNPFYFLP